MNTADGTECSMWNGISKFKVLLFCVCSYFENLDRDCSQPLREKDVLCLTLSLRHSSKVSLHLILGLWATRDDIHLQVSAFNRCFSGFRRRPVRDPQPRFHKQLLQKGDCRFER